MNADFCQAAVNVLLTLRCWEIAQVWRLFLLPKIIRIFQFHHSFPAELLFWDLICDLLNILKLCKLQDIFWIYANTFMQPETKKTTQIFIFRQLCHNRCTRVTCIYTNLNSYHMCMKYFVCIHKHIINETTKCNIKSFNFIT